MRRHGSPESREKHQPHHCPPPDCGKPNPALSCGCGRHTELLPSCTFSAQTSQETRWELWWQSSPGNGAFCRKSIFFFIVFCFCSYYFLEGGGELSWGISLKVYITGEERSIFCLIARIFLMQTNITSQRAELLLLAIAENYTLLDGSLMKTLSGGKNGNFAEIAAGTL